MPGRCQLRAERGIRFPALGGELSADKIAAVECRGNQEFSLAARVSVVFYGRDTIGENLIKEAHGIRSNRCGGRPKPACRSRHPTVSAGSRPAVFRPCESPGNDGSPPRYHG